MRSIFEQERREAARSAMSQYAQCHTDDVQDAYNRGYQKGRETRCHVCGWWLFGAICGFATSASIWSFWP